MVFDLTYFGYGAALPVVGWVAGMAVSFIISAIRAGANR